MPVPRGIRWLVTVHAVLDVLWLYLIFGRRSFAGHDLHALRPLLNFVVFYSQACLLGYWAAYSQGAWWKRVLVMNGAALGVASVPCWSDGLAAGLILFRTVLLITSVVAGVLLLLRPAGEGPRPASPRCDGTGLTFSIKGLMLMTLFAAALISSWRRTDFLRDFDDLDAAPAWCLTAVVLGLVSVWAAFARPGPLWRGGAVVGVSGVLGALIVQATRAVNRNRYDFLFEFLFTLPVLLLNTVCVLGSLNVVRSCGHGVTSSFGWDRTGRSRARAYLTVAAAVAVPWAEVECVGAYLFVTGCRKNAANFYNQERIFLAKIPAGDRSIRSTKKEIEALTRRRDQSRGDAPERDVTGRQIELADFEIHKARSKQISDAAHAALYRKLGARYLHAASRPWEWFPAIPPVPPHFERDAFY